MSHSNYKVSQIAKIVNGRLVSRHNDDHIISDILIDSRRLISPSQALFFAIKSRKNDGHKYIRELYEKGVKNFVVIKVPYDSDYEHATFIEVSDTIEALQSLAAWHRKQYSMPVIGITGSNGKTIVKEWLFQLLADQFNVIRSPKSYNSQIGVPLSVWQLKPEHEMAIFEAGISETDEMEKLRDIIQPDIGIFTNIGQAHSENFIHNSQKIGEKLKLFTKVKTLIYCTDHPEIQGTIIKSELLKRIQAFTWSRNPGADLQILSIEKTENKSSITGLFKKQKINITIPFTDNASVENAIHCWASLLLLDFDPELISKKTEKLQPIAMRLELKEGINNCSIINDSYNSDINSLGIALDFLNQQKQHPVKTLILSDILQSGENEPELYDGIARLIESKKIDKFIGIGPGITRQKDLFKTESYFYLSTSDFLRKHSFASFHNESILLKGARIFEFEQLSRALQQKAHETVLEINLNSLIHNFNYFKSVLDPSTKTMAMVKAFSYGSGSFEIAHALQFNRVDYLAVAYADEGIELRKAGINLPIMVMNPDEESFDGIIMHSLEPEIYSFRVLELLEKSIKKNLLPSNKPVKIHLKIDTGMHRLGFCENEIDKLIQILSANPLIYVQSVFSHLAASDKAEHDDFTRQQINSFRTVSDKIKAKTNHPVLLHILNSGGIKRFPEARFDMVRLGISLYGISSNPEEKEKLQNVSTLKSIISQVKNIPAGETIGYNRSWKATSDMRLGIVPIGYADGLSRSLSNGKGKLMISNKKVSIVGDICMDMCMIDITDVSAEEGDEVLIFGKEYPIENIAGAMNTIPYEVMTGISRRVKRVYFQE